MERLSSIYKYPVVYVRKLFTPRKIKNKIQNKANIITKIFFDTNDPNIKIN